MARTTQEHILAHRAANVKYNETHKEEIAAYQKRWYEANREKQKAYKKAKYAAEGESIRAQAKRRYASDPEYREKTKAQSAINSKRLRETEPERIKEMDKARQQKHKPAGSTRQSFVAMKYRCNNPNCKKFIHYGGRGIKVCDRWQNSFDLFVADLGERPSQKHTLHRLDNDGDYEPGNCVWSIDHKETLESIKLKKAA